MKVVRRWLGPVVLLLLLTAITLIPGILETLLHGLFPASEVVFPSQYQLNTLMGQHLGLVLASSLATIALALPLGVFVTRPMGRELLPVATALAALAQTFPPAAVLALAYPLLGFGFWPTLLALSLYGLLPVIAGVIAGLEAVPKSVIDAGRGLGMSDSQLFWQIEWPLALGPLLGGIRSSMVTNVGTAAIGAAIGAGGLGLLIFLGLETQNNAYIVAGALPTALLALFIDALLAALQATWQPT
jgi:osmoprotectant transport system permease protein